MHHEGRCQEFCVNGFGFELFFEMILSLRRRLIGSVGKWESCFWISTFPPTQINSSCGFPLFNKYGPRRRSCGNVGISRWGRDFQGAVEREESLFLAFLSFHSSAISTACVTHFPTPFYTFSQEGMRSGHRILKRFIASRQFCTGMVHFFEAFRRARYNNLKAASSLGNEPRILMIFRSDMFSDSIAFVV